jgi:hypothetical protein
LRYLKLRLKSPVRFGLVVAIVMFPYAKRAVVSRIGMLKSSQNEVVPIFDHFGYAAQMPRLPRR